MSVVKLKLTIVCEYDADPKYYDNAKPKQMARMDHRNFQNRIDILTEHLDNHPFYHTVEVVEGSSDGL